MSVSLRKSRSRFDFLLWNAIIPLIRDICKVYGKQVAVLVSWWYNIENKTKICLFYVKAARKLWFKQAPGNHLMEEQQRRQLVTKRKVVRMLVIIVVVFATCWLPAQVLHLFWVATTFRENLPEIVMYLVFWVAHANSAINPWLYILLSTNIRLAFNRMVTFRKSHPALRKSTQGTSHSTKASTFQEDRV